jgi:hypothetical protein
VEGSYSFSFREFLKFEKLALNPNAPTEEYENVSASSINHCQGKTGDEKVPAKSFSNLRRFGAQNCHYNFVSTAIGLLNLFHREENEEPVDGRYIATIDKSSSFVCDLLETGLMCTREGRKWLKERHRDPQFVKTGKELQRRSIGYTAVITSKPVKSICLQLFINLTIFTTIS